MRYLLSTSTLILVTTLATFGQSMNSEPIALANNASDFNVDIYPNPATTTELNIKLSLLPERGVNITVYDMNGSQVADNYFTDQEMNLCDKNDLKLAFM